MALRVDWLPGTSQRFGQGTSLLITRKVLPLVTAVFAIGLIASPSASRAAGCPREGNVNRVYDHGFDTTCRTAIDTVYVLESERYALFKHGVHHYRVHVDGTQLCVVNVHVYDTSEHPVAKSKGKCHRAGGGRRSRFRFRSGHSYA
jgi:hypothetical protein